MYCDAVRVVFLMYVADRLKAEIGSDPASFGIQGKADLDSLRVGYRKQIIQSIDLIIQGKA